jgi:hypothetical protein
MMRTAVFSEVGGFDETTLPVSYNDVDLCLRLRHRGYLITYTPYAAVRHHESVSRGPAPGWREATEMVRRYQRDIAQDPYYSPNLTVTRADHSLDITRVDTLACVAYQPLFMRVSESLESTGPIGQELVAQRDGLCAIGIKLSTGGRPPGGAVRLRVYESVDSHTVLASAVADAALVRDGEYHTFYFQPIEKSAGRTFYFEVEHVADGEGGLSIWMSDLSQPALGRQFLHGECREGAVTFRAFAWARGGTTLPTQSGPLAHSGTTA